MIRIIFIKQFTSKIDLNHKATMEHQQTFNIAQKKVLVGYIQYLVTCNILLTSVVIRNFVEKTYESCLGKTGLCNLYNITQYT